VEHLRTGKFYGQTNSTVQHSFATITDTEYTHDKVNWHYHENAYFTFILEGSVIEGNRKEVYNCGAGSLLFHNWQDPHYNIKPRGFTRGFHIELYQDWFHQLNFYNQELQGSFAVNNPDVKFLFYKLFCETKVNDEVTELSTEALLLQILAKMQGDKQALVTRSPAWVAQLKDILSDDPAHKHTLTGLSAMLQLHPAHLSRDFSKYFHCTLGEFIRKLRIEKSLAMLPDPNRSLTDIAFACGFADQSHFVRSFKAFNHTNPLAYRKLLLRAC